MKSFASIVDEILNGEYIAERSFPIAVGKIIREFSLELDERFPVTQKPQDE